MGEKAGLFQWKSSAPDSASACARPWSRLFSSCGITDGEKAGKGRRKEKGGPISPGNVRGRVLRQRRRTGFVGEKKGFGGRRRPFFSAPKELQERGAGLLAVDAVK